MEMEMESGCILRWDDAIFLCQWVMLEGRSCGEI